MSVVAIPAWNSQGVLPPLDAANPTSVERSPYEVSLVEFVKTFGVSSARRDILRGYLQYRAALHVANVCDGFQWINGSFTENVESLETRDPNDLDVVTFAITAAVDVMAAGNLFDHAWAKASYKVDAHYVELDQIDPPELVTWSAYWYSMWSHRRNQQWKGFLKVDLALTEDADAAKYLAQFDVPQVLP